MLEQAHKAENLNNAEIINISSFLFKPTTRTSGLKLSPTYKQRIYVTAFGFLKQRIDSLEGLKVNATRSTLMQILTILVANSPFVVLKNEFDSLVEYMIGGFTISKDQNTNVVVRIYSTGNYLISIFNR